MTAETIAKALGGHRAGATWMARCPAHDDSSPSLAISAGSNGKVLVRCHAGCDQRDVIAALIERGLWDRTGKRQGGIARKHRKNLECEPDPDAKARTEAAIAIWRASHDIAGSLAETYLRSRGIAPSPLPSLRFHPGLKHASGGIWPAMVALVAHGETGEALAVHRTFLARDGHGKAPVDPAKMMLGPCRGGVVRLALKKRFASLDDFLKRWKAAERKQAIIEELEAEGLALDVIADELGKNLDPFDLICHIAFDKKPLTRRERAENVKKRDVFTKYGPQASAALDALLEKYRDEGVLNLDDTNVLRIAPFSGMGSVVQLIKAFGGKECFEKAVHELQDAIYQVTA